MKCSAMVLGAIAATSAAIVAAPTSAAPILYNLTGAFTDGTDLRGSFDFEGSQTGAAQFSNINVCSREFCWNHVADGPYDDGGNQGFFINGQPNTYLGDYIYLSLPIAAVNGTAVISSTTLGANTYTYYYYGGQFLASGTITPAVAAVPEPATWAMMILGMGAIGFAMRRRKLNTRVSYAA